MSFELEKFYGYGTGALEDVEVREKEHYTRFNSYARITELNGKLLTLDYERRFEGDFEKFEAGTEILIHASSGFKAGENFGKCCAARIELAEEGKLTLDRGLSEYFSADDALDYNLQAVTFANFHCLKLMSGGLISPPAYDSARLYGGILALKCSHSAELFGAIDVTNCGISPYQKMNLRPLLSQEIAGTLDADERAGEENFFTNNIFPLNAGDGAVFLFAKEIVTSRTARIGNSGTHGRLNYRGAEDSLPENARLTNVGGSSIFICNERGELYPQNFAKYRNAELESGRGLARCYWATGYANAAGEDQLVHTDIISDESRVSREVREYDYCSGKHGAVENPRYILNAEMRGVAQGNCFIPTEKSNAATLAGFSVGTQCLLVSGESVVRGRLLKIDGAKYYFDAKFSDSNARVVALPEFESLTLEEDLTGVIGFVVRGVCRISAKLKSRFVYIAAERLEVTASAVIGAESAYIIAGKIAGPIFDVTPNYRIIHANEYED